MSMPPWLANIISSGTGFVQGIGSNILDWVWDEDDGVKWDNVVPVLGMIAASRADNSETISDLMGLSPPRPTGYMGGIPDYTYTRNLVPNAFTEYERDNTGVLALDAEEEYTPRRPGGAGRRYFTDGVFGPPSTETTVGEGEEELISVCPPGSLRAGETIPAGLTESYCNQIHTATDLCANPTYAAANPTICTGGPADTTGYTDAQIAGFVNHLQNLYGSGSVDGNMEVGAGLEGDQDFLGNTTLAGGGLASLNPRGYYLGGRTDGMADRIPATINQKQPARLSDGEFVIPADVVSHLGNGSSNAGADQLFSMMDRVRKARTGRKSQGKKINPQQYLG